MQPFVEAARVQALASGIGATSTIERLRAVGRKRGIAVADVDAWCDAFRFVQLLRLRFNATQATRRESPHNHLDPSTLNELDRRILKEAMRQARRLQSRVERDFGLQSGTL